MVSWWPCFQCIDYLSKTKFKKLYRVSQIYRGMAKVHGLDLVRVDSLVGVVLFQEPFPCCGVGAYFFVKADLM